MMTMMKRVSKGQTLMIKAGSDDDFLCSDGNVFIVIIIVIFNVMEFIVSL